MNFKSLEIVKAVSEREQSALKEASKIYAERKKNKMSTQKDDMMGELFTLIDNYQVSHQDMLEKVHPDPGQFYKDNPHDEKKIVSDFHSNKHKLAEFVRKNAETIRDCLVEEMTK